jgi:hypothetical protein
MIYDIILKDYKTITIILRKISYIKFYWLLIINCLLKNIQFNFPYI